MSRRVRYAVIAALLLLLFALFEYTALAPTVSGYVPFSNDGEAWSWTVGPTKPGPDKVHFPTESMPPTVIRPSDQNEQHNSISSSSYPRFGKITASFGSHDNTYEAAIATHNFHNSLHSYPTFILRERMLSGLWSKHAWLMTIIGQELAKPEGERLQWLLWHDRDTVVMNPQIPLHTFVPPKGFEHIELLVTKDKNGLNNGVFVVKVGQWAFKMFASALSIREYMPEVDLKYTEQSAMEEAIKSPWRNSSVAYVPQHWFNGFPPPIDNANSSYHRPHMARPGALLVHFASNRDGLRPERMALWGEIAKNKSKGWDKPINQTGYLAETTEYWRRLGKGESMQNIVKELGKGGWDQWLADSKT